MRATTLLLCMVGALLVSSQSGDATSSKMFPAMRIGLDLGSSFLRRLAEMKEKIREDIDRQAPTWTRLMNQQQPFGHVPWPMLGPQGSFSHGFQNFAVPVQQAPPVPSFAVLRPCGPNVFMPCLSVRPYGGVFPQGVGFQAGNPSDLPAAGPSLPGFAFHQGTALPAVTLLADLDDKPDSTAMATDEGTVGTTLKTASTTVTVANIASTATASVSGVNLGEVTDVVTHAMVTDETTVGTTKKTAFTTVTAENTASTATTTLSSTDLGEVTDVVTRAMVTDKATVGTTVKTAGTTVTAENSASAATTTLPSIDLGEVTDVVTRAMVTDKATVGTTAKTAGNPVTAENSASTARTTVSSIDLGKVTDFVTRAMVTDEGTVGTTAETDPIVTVANTTSMATASNTDLGNITDAGAHAAFTTKSSSKTEDDLSKHDSQAMLATAELTNSLPMVVATEVSQPLTLPAETTSWGTSPIYFINKNYLSDPPKFAKMWENDLGH
uniref:Putative secreted protein n=1 Tax=Ixodes ricinus TaxID=34613 RepID=A0A6B0VBF1_IXORI